MDRPRLGGILFFLLLLLDSQNVKKRKVSHLGHAADPNVHSRADGDVAVHHREGGDDAARPFDLREGGLPSDGFEPLRAGPLRIGDGRRLVQMDEAAFDQDLSAGPRTDDRLASAPASSTPSGCLEELLFVLRVKFRKSSGRFQGLRRAAVDLAAKPAVVLSGRFAPEDGRGSGRSSYAPSLTWMWQKRHLRVGAIKTKNFFLKIEGGPFCFLSESFSFFF